MQKSMDVRGYKKYLTNTYGSSHNTMRFHTMIANIVNKMASLVKTKWWSSIN